MSTLPRHFAGAILEPETLTVIEITMTAAAVSILAWSAVAMVAICGAVAVECVRLMAAKA